MPFGIDDAALASIIGPALGGALGGGKGSQSSASANVNATVSPTIAAVFNSPGGNVTPTYLPGNQSNANPITQTETTTPTGSSYLPRTSSSAIPYRTGVDSLYGPQGPVGLQPAASLLGDPLMLLLLIGGVAMFAMEGGK